MRHYMKIVRYKEYFTFDFNVYYNDESVYL